MNVHISVNITIRNMFMSCNGKLLFQNKAKAVDIDMFGGIFDVWRAPKLRTNVLLFVTKN